MSPALKLDFSKVFLCFYDRITTPHSPRVYRFADSTTDQIDKLASMSVQLFTIPEVALSLSADPAVRGLLVVLRRLHSLLEYVNFTQKNCFVLF
jgi:hypothetical protein